MVRFVVKETGESDPTQGHLCRSCIDENVQQTRQNLQQQQKSTSPEGEHLRQIRLPCN
jgi:hypothetical protein